jgi:hypothetical protein
MGLMPPQDIATRFWPKVDVRRDDECWPWTAARIPKGYGSLGGVQINGKQHTQVGAHRVSYFLAHGRWPRLVRHTCDNPPCVNPAHLLDGDERSNARDMVERGRSPARQRTHCPQGHEYTAENTYRDKLGHRHCRECARINARIQHAKRPKVGYAASRRTHCPQGHAYDEANTIRTPAGHRACRACAYANAAAQSARRRLLDPVAERAKAAARQRAYYARKRQPQAE